MPTLAILTGIVGASQVIAVNSVSGIVAKTCVGYHRMAQITP